MCLKLESGAPLLLKFAGNRRPLAWGNLQNVACWTNNFCHEDVGAADHTRVTPAMHPGHAGHSQYWRRYAMLMASHSLHGHIMTSKMPSMASLVCKISKRPGHAWRHLHAETYHMCSEGCSPCVDAFCRSMSRKSHPDKAFTAAQQAAAAVVSPLVNEARQVLLDDERRAAYDARQCQETLGQGKDDDRLKIKLKQTGVPPRVSFRWESLLRRMITKIEERLDSASQPC